MADRVVYGLPFGAAKAVGRSGRAPWIGSTKTCGRSFDKLRMTALRKEANQLSVIDYFAGRRRGVVVGWGWFFEIARKEDWRRGWEYPSP